REHRLYQADWLLRFYGFELDEILAGGEDGMLDLGLDPKLAWALKHRGQFPIDVNRAPREMLLRVPGLGARTVDRLLSTRRQRAIRTDDLTRLRLPLAKLLPFLVTADRHPRAGLLDRADLRQMLAPRAGLAAAARPRQMVLL
ncbi:MAG: biotin synthase, partial [Paracraurococcus sp.]